MDEIYDIGEEILCELIIENHELASSKIVEIIKNRLVQSETNPDDLVLAILKVD